MNRSQWLEVLLLLCGGSVIALFVWFLRYIIHLPRQKQVRLWQRVSLTPDQFYDQFYSSSSIPKAVVLSARSQIAKAIEVDEGLIRPSDRFDNELAPVKGWEYFDDAALDLKQYVEKVAAQRGVYQVDLANVKTVADYINLVAAVSAG